MRKILIDADACPVTNIIEKVSIEKGIPLTIVCDTSHVLSSDYAEVITVDRGADAADFVIVNQSLKGDIVVTQDYGLAAMVLGKGAYAIHQSGMWYTNGNMDQMLFERHMSKKVRRTSGKFHSKGSKKRTVEEDIRFEESLRNLIDLREGSEQVPER